MPRCNASAIADWLTDGARSAALPQEVLAQLCEQLLACGIPLSRAAVLVRTLHPEVTGRRFLWRPESGVEVGELVFARLQTPDFLDSPVARVYATAAPMRRRLANADEAAEFALLRDLRADGATDYLAVPLLFTDGTVHVASWTTRQPEGFADEHIDVLHSITAPLARVAEVRALTRTARTLLDTYVGAHAGQRILSGQIRRGHTETIRAVIWLSDMRGFTALSDRLQPRTLIELLNRYFDCQVPAIQEHGGEVLKFIGDGLLAIFPLRSADDTGNACSAALRAAAQSKCSIDALATDASQGTYPRFGVALHVGEVLYGNIGGANRLDFTCIGPAVNLAARLEKLAGQLGRSTIVSSDFAARCSTPLALLGEFALPGLSGLQTAYGLTDESPRAES